MKLIGGRIHRRETHRDNVCVHEKHWTDEEECRDFGERSNPDICYECLDAIHDIFDKEVGNE